MVLTKGKNKKRKLSRLILDSILLILSFACSLALIISLFAKTTNPNNASLPALLGLLSPGLYILELMLFLYWVVRWRVYSLILLVVLLVGLHNVKLYFKLDLGKDYLLEKSKKSKDFTVISYNACGFINPKQDDFSSTMSPALELLGELSPDILCIQEFQTTPEVNLKMVDDKLSLLPYKRVKYKILNYDNNSGWGLAIYSKRPIINSSYIAFEGSNNSAMWADVNMGKDTIRVYNIHLQSSKITRDEQDFILQEMMIDSSAVHTKNRLKNIASKIKDNTKIRANQVDSLLVNMNKSPYPMIVCGDFNDTPMSYAYNKIRGQLNDAFCQRGAGISATFLGVLRIDYILYDDKFRATSYSTPSSEFSDHKPVVVSFEGL